MRNSKIRWLGILLAVHLSGCESIKSIFPDKMQDYRYSQEIPPLELPPELKSDAIKTEDDIHPQAVAAAPAQSTPGVTETPSYASSEAAAQKPQQTPQALVEWSEGGSRLQINKPFDKAWFVVSKALTHKAIEITDYDRSQGVFFVQYDPEKYEVRDGSIWDEVAFFFGARDSHEMPYRVRVIEAGERTTVVVTDENDAPVTQGPGLSLTKLLYDTIAEEAEGKKKPEDEESENTGEEQPSNTEQQKDSGAESNPAPENDGQRETGAEENSPAER